MESQEAAYRGSETPESIKGDGRSGINYSPSVREVRSAFETGTTVSSMDLVQALARLHPEYAKGRFEKVAHESYLQRTFDIRPLEEWFSNVDQLFDPETVPELHGRLFALGLCELDHHLKEVFETTGILSALHDELKEEFTALLNERSPFDGDPARLHLDSDSREDHLGRDGFVEALATWLNRFWRQSNSQGDNIGQHSFMMHLHGPWGSGKSTLLNLLEQKLTPQRKDDRKTQEKKKEANLHWMVIHFNAWQHSHVEPAWWPLLNQLYKESLVNLKKTKQKRKAWAVWWYDLWWKLISGNKSTGYWFALFGVLLVLVSLPDMNENLQSYIQFATFAGTVVTGGSYFLRSLIWGSAGSAQDYLKLNQDPLDKIKEYFVKIVGRIDQPVMIYIDDLDRCPSSYVVDLLESLQTLFNDSRVFYVLAADRRWLYGSFEERYGEFRNHIEEPGKQIGYLFLDKLFQLSISVPQVSPEVREDYLNYLYLDKEKEQRNLDKMRRQIREEFEQVRSDPELVRRADREGASREERQMRREEAVRASAKAEIEVSTEYFLKQFAHLLEPNPRAIKRLVNNYGIYRAIVLLSDPAVIDSGEKRKKFALWNILAMRWPMLAEVLEDETELIPFVAEGTIDKIDRDEVRDLTAMREVQDVLKGKGVDTTLDAGYIKRILNLQAAPA